MRWDHTIFQEFFRDHYKIPGICPGGSKFQENSRNVRTLRWKQAMVRKVEQNNEPIVQSRHGMAVLVAVNLELRSILVDRKCCQHSD